MDAFRGELEARRSLLERDVVIGVFDGARGCICTRR
jgi:hypothetical protein